MAAAGLPLQLDDGSSRDVLAVAGPPPADAQGTNPPSTCAGGPSVASPTSPDWRRKGRRDGRARGHAYRVAERDGVEQMLTADYSPDRVNVAVTGGVVTRAWYG